MKTDANMVLKLVGYKIKIRRKLMKMNQLALSEKLTVSRTSITNIECGKQNIGIDRLVEIADALNCDLADLLPKIR